MRNGLDIYRGPNSLFKAMSDFDRIFDEALVSPWTLVGKLPTANREWFEPRVDIQEHDEAFFLSADLPGVKKEDVKIGVEGRTLTISGERKRATQNERMQGKFTRSFTLPESADVSKIEAKLDHGVLELSIPKAEAAKPRSIEIKSGES